MPRAPSDSAATASSSRRITPGAFCSSTRRAAATLLTEAARTRSGLESNSLRIAAQNPALLLTSSTVCSLLPMGHLFSRRLLSDDLFLEFQIAHPFLAALF